MLETSQNAVETRPSECLLHLLFFYQYLHTLD